MIFPDHRFQCQIGFRISLDFSNIKRRAMIVVHVAIKLIAVTLIIPLPFQHDFRQPLWKTHCKHHTNFTNKQHITSIQCARIHIKSITSCAAERKKNKINSQNWMEMKKRDRERKREGEKMKKKTADVLNARHN